MQLQSCSVRLVVKPKEQAQKIILWFFANSKSKADISKNPTDLASPEVPVAYCMSIL